MQMVLEMKMREALEAAQKLIKATEFYLCVLYGFFFTFDLWA